MAMFLPAGTLRLTECSTPPFSLDVLEAHVAEFDRAAHALERCAAGEIFGGLVEHFEDAGAGRESLLQRTERGHQRAHGRGGQQQRGEETPELADRHVVAD